jgi:PTH2 family peptidyl-tRNA hydrolase
MQIVDRREDYKQVIVVRKDLRMGTGKLAAQVAHAAVMAVENTKMRNINWFNSWFNAGQAKVVVKVQTLQELHELRKHAESLHLPVAEVIDKVTNHLKLL